MVAKNGAGTQASPGSLANASTSDTHPTSPLEFFGEYDEITEHPNALLEQPDELEDTSTPEQTFQWLIDNEFPRKFALTMRDGKFNGPATLDLFGCASTIKEAMEMFKEFELPMASLTRVWGIARARSVVAQDNQTEHASQVDPRVNIGAAEEPATEFHPGGRDPGAQAETAWETEQEPGSPGNKTGDEAQEHHDDHLDGIEVTDKFKAQVAKALRVSEAPKLGASKEDFWSIKDWNRQVSKVAGWIGYHSKPMQLAIEGMTTGFADADPVRLHEELSSSDKLRDELLGAHLYNNAPTEYMDHLDDKEGRCIEGAASAIKIVHHITSVILVDADDLKDDLVSKMTDKNGRWKPLRLEQAGSLLKELNQLDQHVLEIRGTGACKEPEVDLTWLNAMKRLVSTLEGEATLWRQFGGPLNKFKKENPRWHWVCGVQ